MYMSAVQIVDVYNVVAYNDMNIGNRLFPAFMGDIENCFHIFVNPT